MKPQIDPRSDTWKAIESYADERLNKLRLQNDSSIDQVATATLRGRIAGIKELLALAKDPAFDVDEGSHGY